MGSLGSRASLVLLLALWPLHAAAAPVDAAAAAAPLYALAARAQGQGPGLCWRHLRLLREALDRRSLWALKMLDASGAPAAGFLWGNNFWLGSRAQCSDIPNRAPLQVAASNRYDRGPAGDTFPPFGVAFQVALLRHNSSLQLRFNFPNEDLIPLGLCLPASCSPADTRQLLAAQLSNASLLVQDLYGMGLQLLNVRYPQADSGWLLQPGVLTILFLFAMIICLVAAGTIYDAVGVSEYKPESKVPPVNTQNGNATQGERSKNDVTINYNMHREAIGKFLLCFSVYSNTGNIMKTDVNVTSTSALHGIRFLSMAWVIVGHTALYFREFLDNKGQVLRLSEEFWIQIFSNAAFAVDTFLFISGFLLSYMYYKRALEIQLTENVSFKKNARDFILMILQRFLRLTPTYLVVIGIVYVTSIYLTSSSLLYTSEHPEVTCAQYWWRNILYINNFFKREEMCLSWSWYLSIDMQCFIIGSFLLILSKRHFTLSATILAGLIVSSCLATGYIAYIHNYVPTLETQFLMAELLYDPPWTRIGPYMIGVATGYWLAKLKGQLSLNKWSVALAWFLGFLCNTAVLFGLYERLLSPATAAAYAALSRTVWGIGIAWIVVACCTGHGGIVNKILSFQGWIPFSRLTYCAYLLNPLLMMVVHLGSGKALHMEIIMLGSLAMGQFIFTYIFAYALSIMFESPNILLQKYMFHK